MDNTSNWTSRRAWNAAAAVQRSRPASACSLHMASVHSLPLSGFLVPMLISQNRKGTFPENYNAISGTLPIVWTRTKGTCDSGRNCKQTHKALISRLNEAFLVEGKTRGVGQTGKTKRQGDETKKCVVRNLHRDPSGKTRFPYFRIMKVMFRSAILFACRIRFL